jgi:rubrerythrin
MRVVSLERLENEIDKITRMGSVDELSFRLLKEFSEDISFKTEPEKHGHWIHGKELSRDYIGDVCIGIHYDKYWCSECNYPVEGQPLWAYCPNCGAKMNEVEK